MTSSEPPTTKAKVGVVLWLLSFVIATCSLVLVQWAYGAGGGYGTARLDGILASDWDFVLWFCGLVCVVAGYKLLEGWSSYRVLWQMLTGRSPK